MRCAREERSCAPQGRFAGCFVSKRLAWAGLAVGVVLPAFVRPAKAVVITNVTTGTTLFRDDFESGSFSPSVGTENVGPDVTVTNSTTPPAPGPAQGSFYAQLFRDSDTNGQGNLFAHPSAVQATAGDLIRLSTMVFLPNDGGNARGVFILDDGNFNSARALVISDGAGHVIAETGPNFSLVDTGVPYTPGVWQQWDLDYVIGSSTFGVSVDGVSASGFASHSVGQVSLGELFNGNHTAGTFWLDAVPEPSAALAVCLVGLLIPARRRGSR
jgi:hypothetical protein